MNKTVILRAPVLTQSGYGVHARQVASWLLGRSDVDMVAQALPWGDTPWLLDSNSYGGLVGKLMAATKPCVGKPDISFQIQLPHEWDPSIAKINVGWTAGVETDVCNPEWIAACNKMTAIVVPSKHVESCLRSSGTLTVPLHVIPESWASQCALPAEELPKLPDFDTEINFLLFGQLTGTNPYNDRKNTFFALRWLCEMFKDDERIGIVLKTNACRNTLIDRDIVTNSIKGLLAQVRHGIAPRVHLVHGDMSPDEVAALYKHRQIFGLVSATRGEGFGLPLLEAAASGLPIAATAWSGHLDFLSNLYSKIEYNLSAVHHTRVDGKIFVRGSRWAEANEQDFKRKVRDLIADRENAIKRARELRAAVLTTHSQDVISATCDRTFAEMFK